MLINAWHKFDGFLKSLAPTKARVKQNRYQLSSDDNTLAEHFKNTHAQDAHGAYCVKLQHYQH